jgi:hypothetical protein
MAAALMVALVAAGSNTSPDSVTPRFAWPDGLVLDVTKTVDMTNVPQRVPMGMVFRLSANRERGSFVVRASEFHAEAPPPTGPALEKAATLKYPAVRVTALGQFEDVELTAEQEALAGNITEGLKKKALPTLSATTGREVIQREGFAFWQEIAGAWARRRLARGVPIRTRTKTAVPMGDGPAPMMETAVVREFAGRVPCGATAAADVGCVKLVSTMQYSRAAMIQVFKEGMRGLGRPVSQEYLETIPETLVHTELVTEPETLVPHSWRRVVEVRSRDRKTGREKPKSEHMTVDETFVFRRR